MEEYTTVSQLQLSEKTVYRPVQGGELPRSKVGGSWRFRRRGIDRLGGQAGPRKPSGSRIARKDARNGGLRFIEAKGRISGADTVMVMLNEMLYSLNEPEEFLLAIVEFEGDDESHRIHYVRRPLQKDPDFCVTSVNYDLGDMIARGEEEPS